MKLDFRLFTHDSLTVLILWCKMRVIVCVKVSTGFALDFVRDHFHPWSIRNQSLEEALGLIILGERVKAEVDKIVSISLVVKVHRRLLRSTTVITKLVTLGVNQPSLVSSAARYWCWLYMEERGQSHIRKQVEGAMAMSTSGSRQQEENMKEIKSIHKLDAA